MQGRNELKITIIFVNSQYLGKGDDLLGEGLLETDRFNLIDEGFFLELASKFRLVTL